MNRLHIRGAALATALVAAVIGGSTHALAMTAVTTQGTPGWVQENALPGYPSGAPVVTCDDTFASGGAQFVTIAGPTIYAAALSNGSRTQLVSYRADLVDLTLGRTFPGSWTNWQSTSVNIGVVNRTVTGEVDHRMQVKVYIWWWDPVSRTYSGYKSYTVNSYLSLSFEYAGINSLACQ